ncbi:MAG: hypothetical protein KC438_08665, partial [Thermomicrobiales bacterium]|nr:hypothetical protein [Thermomicrobiales bacterium]
MARAKTGSRQPTEAVLAATPRQHEVLRIIRDHQNITRAEIGALLQASASQVSRLTAPLIARRVVTVEHRLPHAEGRPTELLSLAGDTHYVVGIDVGGLAQEAVVTNLRGDVVGAAHRTGSPARSRSSIIDGLVDLVDRAIGKSEIPREQVLG